MPEARVPLLGWLGSYAEGPPGIEVVEYAVSVMKRFPQHKEVQDEGCYALRRLFAYHPALMERAGEVGAVEALVHGLDRFVASHPGVRNFGVAVLRQLTDGHPANAARLEAAGGAHYLQQQAHA